ncbi:ATP-dependent Clp protease proteolytic subunit [Salmonella enterica]|nr:peptidase S14 [Salmonella enterica]EJX4926774.1 ATP-dependent Clp protease proteolytic subunit [Salmonella enterica]EKQ0892873.1 ATP-dependent Clp protease proteolytic subunit [Salmonella enterica]
MTLLKKTRVFLSCLLFTCPTLSFAQVHWFKNETIKPEDIHSVKILYDADVNPTQITELSAVLDEINNTYTALKQIDLYINSYGGKMDDGYMGYQAIKASTIPVKTINSGMIASSATLLYCGGKSREMAPEASFMLHPAKAANSKNDYISPNEIDMLKKDSNQANNYFYSIYSTCTNMKKDEISRILYSEDNFEYIYAEQARNISLANKIETGIKTTQISYYITSDNDNK